MAGPTWSVCKDLMGPGMAPGAYALPMEPGLGESVKFSNPEGAEAAASYS